MRPNGDHTILENRYDSFIAGVGLFQRDLHKMPGMIAVATEIERHAGPSTIRQLERWRRLAEPALANAVSRDIGRLLPTPFDLYPSEQKAAIIGLEELALCENNIFVQQALFNGATLLKIQHT